MKRFILLSLLVAMTALTSCNKEVVKTYSAVMSQSGTDAPEMDVFQNTIGDITWTYVSEGIYHGTRERGFPLGYTFTLCNNGVDGAISGDLRHWSEDLIELRTFAGGSLSNGCTGLNFEIQVRESKRP